MKKYIIVLLCAPWLSLGAVVALLYVGFVAGFSIAADAIRAGLED